MNIVLVKRYVVMLAGVISSAFATALITKAALGTSPFASIPYTISLIWPVLTLGNWTIIYSFLLIFIELIFMKGKIAKRDLGMQVFLVFTFGYVVDAGMFVMQGFVPDQYMLKLFTLLIGCVLLAFGAYLQILADVGMLAIDAFEYRLSQVLHRDYALVRPAADMAMIAIALVLCLVFLHALTGVREGTLVVALIAGKIVTFFQKHLKPLENAVFSA